MKRRKPVLSVLVALATVAGVSYVDMLEMPAEYSVKGFAHDAYAVADAMLHHATVAGYRRPGVRVGDVAALLKEAVMMMPAEAHEKDSF